MDQFMDANKIEGLASKLFSRKVRSYTWSEISQMDPSTLRALLKGEKFLIFLYETERPDPYIIGHWMVMIDHGDGVEVFDSHGSTVNPLEWYSDKSILKHVDKSAKDRYKLEPILANKLFDIGYRFVDWNDEKLQKKSADVMTCGYWVILRLMMMGVNVDDFGDWIKESAKINGYKKNYDNFVFNLFQ